MSTPLGSASPPAPHDGDRAVTDDSSDYQRESVSWRQVKRPLLWTVAAVLALTLAFIGGMWTADTNYPGDNSVDAGFARDMSAHHAQAIDMSMTVRNKSTATDIQTLAYDVVTTQENQRGQMSAWLTTWGLSQAVSGKPMDWMKQTGHQHAGLAKGQMLLSDGRMPGMASQAELQRLAKASGKDAEILYLQLMIVHHRAGVEMAQAAEGAASDAGVVSLAGKMVAGQSSEITLMTSMLKERGATPWPNGVDPQEKK